MSLDWYTRKQVDVPKVLELAELGTFSVGAELLYLRDVLKRIEDHPCEDDLGRRTCCLFRHWANEALNFKGFPVGLEVTERSI